ncbi:MAG: CBS domain-containing protein [Candidatus Bathyarchaeia archaeon]
MRAKDVMVKDIVKVGSCALVDNAVKVMNKNNIGCLIIEDNGETRGIVTQRDLLKKVLEKARDPRKLVVSDIMTKKLIVGSPDMEIHEAARLMFQKKIKKLPIVENGKLVGLITLSNIAWTVGVDQKMIDMVEKLSNMRAI